MRSILKAAIMAVIAFVMILSSCAETKVFRGEWDQPITAKPYGWANPEDKIQGVQYRVCKGNIVWSVIGLETVIAPILLTGWSLYEPVSYSHKSLTKTE